MMNKDIFWQMIDKARETAGGMMNDCIFAEDRISFCEYLEHELAQLGDSDLIEWQQIYKRYYIIGEGYEWNTSKLKAAAHYINGYCSDNGFGYFTNWLIASGKSVYLAALHNPDDLADIEINGYALQRDLSYVAVNVFNKKHNLQCSDKLFYTVMDMCAPMTDEEQTSITSEITYAPKSDINNEDIYAIGIEAKKYLPKLFKKYNRSWKKIYYYLHNPEEYDRSDLYISYNIEL